MKIEDINNFISNKIEENLNLDYKASDALQRNDKKTNEFQKMFLLSQILMEA